MRKTNSQIKTCPLLDKNCLKAGCELYNELLQRCEISLMNYNLYLLAGAIKQQLELEKK